MESELDFLIRVRANLRDTLRRFTNEISFAAETDLQEIRLNLLTERIGKLNDASELANET